MVFFTCIIVVFILYYLQSDGLIFVIIIALLAELINIFLTQTLTKSVENKQKAKYSQIINAIKKQLAAKEKTIAELKKVHEDSARILYKANIKIKDYEKQLGIIDEDDEQVPESQKEGIEKTGTVPKKSDPPLLKKETDTKDKFMDLPSGSNRKQTPT